MKTVARVTPVERPTTLPLYEPPTDGDDLNVIEEAIVRCLTAIILRERREEAAARSTAPPTPRLPLAPEL